MDKGKVLLSGGAGFIGSHLCKLLLDEGWKVDVIDNLDPYYEPLVKLGNIAAFRQNPAFSFHTLDIREMDQLLSLEGDFDVIVHLAAKAGVRPSIVDPRGYQDVNVRGTQNMLELARQKSVKQFVFASSSSVYGLNEELPWQEETAVLKPISPYASTKVSGELLGHVYSHLFDMRFLALRFFTVYGPRQRPDLAIHKFARKMMAGEPIPFFGDGSTQRDYTYVSDTVAGIRAAMDYDGSMYEIFNLGNDHIVSLSEMVHQLEKVLGIQAIIEFLPEVKGDLPKTWADISKARKLLGYNPSFSFEEGMQNFAQWIMLSSSETDDPK